MIKNKTKKRKFVKANIIYLCRGFLYVHFWKAVRLLITLEAIVTMMQLRARQEIYFDKKKLKCQFQVSSYLQIIKCFKFFFIICESLNCLCDITNRVGLQKALPEFKQKYAEFKYLDLK